MVQVALDESPGVLKYELSTLKRQAWIRFDPGQTDTEVLIRQIKKRTRYSEVSVLNES